MHQYSVFNSVQYPKESENDTINSGILIVRSDAYRVDWNPLLMSSG